MTARRRRLLALLLLLLPIAALLTIVAVASLPQVQRAGWEKVTARIEAETGWRVEAEQVRLRLWPARLLLSGLEVGQRDTVVLTVAQVEARWRWTALLRTTPRLSSLHLEGADLDLRGGLPETARGPEPEGAPVDPLSVIEIERFGLRDGGAVASGAGVEVSADGVRVAARLTAARLGLELEAGAVTAEKDGRSVRVAPVASTVEVQGNRAVITALRTSGVVGADLSGTVSWGGDGPAGSVEGELGAALPELLEWWDPELASRLRVGGRLELAGRAGWSESGGYELDLAHVGPPLRAGGFDVAELELGTADGDPQARLAGGWGWARVRARDGRVGVAAELRSVAVGRILAAAEVDPPVGMPADAAVSGQVDLELGVPFAVAETAGRAQLGASWTGGGIELVARAADGAVEVERVVAELAGARLVAGGRLGADGRTTASARLEVGDPAVLRESLRPWLALDGLPVVAGGPVTAEFELGGSLGAPEITASAAWERPEVAGVLALSAEATATGGLDALRWSARADLLEGVSLAAEGSMRPREGSAEGSWRIAAESVGAVAERLRVEVPTGLEGQIAGEGRFRVGGGSWHADARLTAVGLEVGGRRLEAADLELTAGSEGPASATLRADLAGGELLAEGSAGLSGFEAPVSARIEWREIDPAALVDGLPGEVQGTLSGSMLVAGTIAAPTALARLSWRGAEGSAALGRLELEGSLDEGVLRAATSEADVAGGPLEARAVVPLGDLPLPEWLWADAPGGPLEVHLAAAGVDSAAVLAALGRPALPVSAGFDLKADARWDFDDPERRLAEAVLENLEVRSAVSRLAATGPLVVTYGQGVAELEPVELLGPRSRIELAGRVDPGDRSLRVSAAATLSPELTSLLPFPIRAEQPLDVQVELAGPWDAPVGSLHLRHPDGRLILRDPPVVLGDLELVADVDNGVVSIRSGSATLNRGVVQIGGGWDPESGQGIVLELEDVVVLLPGQIVSRWSGSLGVGPTEDGLALVEGELVLDGGVWEIPVSLSELVGGGGAAPLAPDDPLFGVLLDVDVRGRGQIRVDNNLGRFDVGWSVLSVTGTAAEPRVVGEVRIAAGGVLTVGGQTVRLQRGTIELTGEPGAEPRIELVPEAGTAFSGGGEGVAWDDLARIGLAQGVTSFLGLDNEELEPADIAVETEKPPATRFSIGQSLGRNLALFFTTDLREPQDSTTLLQLWNLRQVPGLALQVFESTDEEWGWAAIERYSWGGSEEAGQGPVVRKVRFEGDWPLGKRSLRRAAGLKAGRPFDPFLLFVAELRLERALAAEGFYSAVVSGTATSGETRVVLSFTCDPGPQLRYEFRGDEVKKAWRREVVSLYLPPPLEGTGFRAMAEDLRRRLASAGHPDARVEVVREGEVVVVEVERGPEVRLTGPRVVGVSPGAAATVAAILGGPAELASLLRGGDAVHARVERLLRREGFPDARVVSVRREPVEEGVAEVVLEVEAGDPLEIAGVRLEGRDPLGAVEVFRSTLAPGSVLSRRRLDDAVQRLRRAYREAGYVDVELRADVERGAEERPTVVLRLEPGPRRMLESVEITGLGYLREGPLRHGITIAEGDPLSPSAVDETVANIATFRPVQRVQARAVPTGPGTSKVVVEVFEKDRWTVGGGARWSSDRGTEAVVDLRDDNLFGRGLSLNLRGRYASDEQDGLILLSLPPLPGGRVTFSGSLRYNRFDDADAFGNVLRKETREGTVEASYKLDPGSAVRAYYTLRRVRTFELDPLFPEFAFDVTTDIATVGTQYYRDRLDDPFLPTRGTYLAADLGWSASAIGSDVDTVRTFLTGSLAWSPGGDVTLYQSLRVGVAEALSGELDPELKFKTGGQGTIRGFEFESVGPVDDLSRVVGGGALIILNEELRVRVWKGLRLAAFVDAGNIWETWQDVSGEVAVGAGFGFRWATPIGPIWGDVAWPVANEGLNRGPKYYIGFGKPF